MDKDRKEVRDRLLAIMHGYNDISLGRLAHKISAASRDDITKTELDILRHRGFGRESDATRCETWLIQHRRDIELAKVLMEISAMMSAEEIVASYMAAQNRRPSSTNETA